jgi:mono/diheme cytochrome c family protein
MSRSTSTLLLVASLVTGCVADSGDGPAPALTGSSETVLAGDGGSDTALAKHSDTFSNDISGALSDDAGSDALPDASGEPPDPASEGDAEPDGGADGGAAPSAEDAGPPSDDGGEGPPEDDASQPPPDPPLGCAVASTLANRCVGCHGVGARNGVELDALAKLSRESAKMPGELIAQRIVARMRDADRPMPPRGELVPEAEIAAVEAWIAAGMPEASCP